MKNKIAGCIFFFSLLFTSCTKETVNNVDQAYSAVYNIDPNSWITTNAGLSYFTNINIPELTDGIVQNGGVDVYLSFDNGTTYETIPEVYNGITYGSVQQYQQVTVDLYDVNGGAITAPTGIILAKIVLIDATPLH